MQQSVNVSLDGKSYIIEVLGEPEHDGSQSCLLAEDEDLSSGCAWTEQGYALLPFLTADEMVVMRGRIRQLARDHLAALGQHTTTGWQIHSYHKKVLEETTHEQFVKNVRGGVTDCLGDDLLDAIDARISVLLGRKVTSFHPERLRDRVAMRIVRPNKPDFNPPHRDAWIDHLRHGMNIYVPLFGSNARTSLALAPGSHRWAEAEGKRTKKGASMGGKTFHVPSYLTDIAMIRPDPKPNEVLVFSPYLLHGMGANLDNTRTRFSLEMRFWPS